jgi:RNA polymerase sigma-70 factor (sigma-B/F/G subfamily)
VNVAIKVDHLDIEIRSDGEVDVVRLAGTADLASSVRLRLALYECLDAGRLHLVVDLSSLRLLDCASVDVLLNVQAEAEERGGSLRAPGATGLPLDVLEITGTAKRLRAYDDASYYAETLRVAPVEEPTASQWGTVNELLRQMRELDQRDWRRAAIRDRVIRDCLPLAQRLSRRFRNLGETDADLNQVAALGLVKAIDGFDPEYGTDFGGYATPTIVGELKRHFRDKGWGVRVPRRLQELGLEISRARTELPQRLGRSPTAADVAEFLGVDEEQVIEALVASSGYRPMSIHAPIGVDEDSGTLADTLGEQDADLDLAEFREALRPLLASLPPRIQSILVMRFYGNMTQSEIATELDISQMHVSRLLNRTLAQLRESLLSG